MKKIFIILVAIFCFSVCACSKLETVSETEMWDCSVVCAEESKESSYVLHIVIKKFHHTRVTYHFIIQMILILLFIFQQLDRNRRLKLEQVDLLLYIKYRKILSIQ